MLEQRPKTVISIIGTTGVGKSDLGVALAEMFNGEIINADSMQMYKGLPQITNKHPISDRHGIPHHIMNHVDWNEEYHIHRFQKECLAKIAEIHSRGKVPILVGGTHYYLQSVLFVNKTIGTEDGSEEKQLTEAQQRMLDSGSGEQLHELLMKYDPKISMKFHPNDVRRLRRALEVYYKMGKPASQFYKEQQKQQTFRSRLRYTTMFLWLYSGSSELNLRLDKRVDKMMDQGALQELTELYDYYDGLPNPKPKMDTGCFQVIGFKEFLPYLSSRRKDPLDGQDPLFMKCCEEMKLRTRQYAKRQVKWIKNTLIPDLQSEADHDWCHFGKVYVVNASDLSQWHELVEHRAVQIVQEFLKSGGKVNDSVVQVPKELEDQNLIHDKSNKFDETKWVYHTCGVCINKVTGEPLVLVGDQYDIHMKGRRHRRNFKYKSKK
ncbi:hypothetical protein FOA43_002141 [Brettanomyces nanus]|uniref:tRNA dimethylallyltransferase n=1 Tax=Eeniella nana TaxID=13502 RepID=A0A875S366_EENNA|nr:uncharacterized protein FOA43_002141 [Brettanomyces nanus]QPG74805.1 hypothetical protein FOA43_002141 [Brettanomyces nanus]